MNLKKKKHLIRDYGFILLGTAIMGLAYKCVYDQIGLVTGGFTGLSIIIKSITATIVPGGVPLWLTTIVLNAPFFIIALIVLGKRFLGRTIFGTIMLSVWLYILPVIDIVQNDFIMAAIFGGVTAGAGMGFVLRARSTTGGTDMVATLAHKLFFKHVSIVKLLQILDGCVVVTGMFVFGLHNTLYSIVAIFISAKVSDLILEGFKNSKAAYIITDRYQEVTQAIFEDLDRGATGLHAKGMYTGKDRLVLYCVVPIKQIAALKELVVEIDPNAFVIVSDVKEVLGEGFLDYRHHL